MVWQARELTQDHGARYLGLAGPTEVTANFTARRATSVPNAYSPAYQCPLRF